MCALQYCKSPVLKGSCLFLEGLFMLCSRNPTQSEECLEFTCTGINPLLPFSLSSLLFVFFGLSTLDSGLPPSPAFDVRLCHWVQTCSALSLQPFEVLEFLSDYRRLFFFPPLSCRGAPLCSLYACAYVKCGVKRLSCTRGTFRGINWAQSVFHFSQRFLTLTHFTGELWNRSELTPSPDFEFDLLLWPPMIWELKWKICFF